MNAQAKEDLAYLRETNKNDMQYLMQVKDSCGNSDNEFKVRKKMREDEIAELDEAISILTAAAAAAKAQPKKKPAPVKTLVNTAKHVRRVFSHHHSSAKRSVLKVAAPKAPSAA